MERTVIMERLREVIEQYLEVELPERLLESNRLFEQLNIDSIMVLQLVVYIEEVFAVNVPEEDVDPAAFQTLGSLITFIQQLQQAQTPLRVNG